MTINAFGPLDDVAHCGCDQFRDFQLGFDGDFGCCDFGVFTFLASVAGKLDLSITAARWRIISEDIKRVFAGMEAAFTSDNAALMLEALTQLKLVSSAAQLGVKAFVCNNLSHADPSPSRG
ncbi:hypothetical protein OHI65_14785 [Brucella sp. MAB-22]|uniref:hypothetical protein n=1 Tax=Brucella sp. MAB-22 TaxID=2986424 RepID=UPI002220B82E|nr:hypothetical protein [Brucella sp. MAB-22]UYT57734.1 hypothetical protein OHI65_14785 [Brucella sp. MAB-22]